MLDHLTNPTLLDSMLTDYHTFTSNTVWKDYLSIQHKETYEYELWRKWLRI